MISLESEQRDALVESAERFIADRYPASEHLQRLQSESRFSHERWCEIVDLGWLSTSVSESSGGLGLKYSILSHLVEALGRGLILEPFASQVALGGYILDAAFGGELRDRAVRQWLVGEAVVAFADQGSRKAGFFDRGGDLSVEFSDAHYTLTGTKAVVIDGSSAGYFLISATLLDSENTYSVFLIPAQSENLLISKYRSFDGRDLADLEFRGVEIPASLRLEFDHSAMRIVEEAKTLFALLIACESLGIMKTVVEMTYRYLNEREQFGVKIAEFQALQHRVANLLLASTRAESLVAIARQQTDEFGLSAARDSIAAANNRCTTIGTFIAQEAIQLHGAIGMTDEFILGHYLKRLTANGFIAGSSDEQFFRFMALREFGT